MNEELRIQLAEVPARLRTLIKVARTSGLMWEISARGVSRIARVLRAGARNPSQIYRIHALNSPDKVAIRWHDRSISYGELDARIDAIALGLKKRGFRRGDSMVLMMRNRPEFVETAAAMSRMGCAAVSVSWRSTPSELQYLAAHCGAKGVCVEHDLWPVVEQVRSELPKVRSFFSVGGEPQSSHGGASSRANGGRAEGGVTVESYEALLDDRGAFEAEEGALEDASVVIYTSGTTGKPKGAVRKFPKDMLPAALRFIAETPLRVDDVHLTPCPLYHSTAYGFLTLTHMLGATVVLMDEFKPEPFLQHVEAYGVTSTAVVPTMLHRVLQLGPEVLRKYDSRSLRCIFAGGAPLPGPLAIEAMDFFGDILFNFYGATETGLVTLAKPDDLRAAPTTIGRPVPGNEIRLIDDAGKDVAPGAVGELYVRNKMLVAGYHNDEGATRDSMYQGFFSVGDLARRDRDGRYFIEGRKRDMVISGGVNVYPAEVEGVLEQHPAIAEVAVVGVPDSEWGERVCAFVARKPEMTLDVGELKAWMRERLAGPKVPRDYVFVDALPRNPTGKVLKRELREHGSKKN